MEKVKYTLPEIEVVDLTDDFIIVTSGWNSHDHEDGDLDDLIDQD